QDVERARGEQGVGEEGEDRGTDRGATETLAEPPPRPDDGGRDRGPEGDLGHGERHEGRRAADRAAEHGVESAGEEPLDEVGSAPGEPLHDEAGRERGEAGGCAPQSWQAVASAVETFSSPGASTFSSLTTPSSTIMENRRPRMPIPWRLASCSRPSFFVRS